eukprot:scaffold2990_cov119-Isochrysis_galbana.AAC.6
MLAEFAGNVIECYGARRGEAVTRLSFSVRVGLIARRLFSSQFFGSGREWICVHWYNLMDAEGGGGQCSRRKRFQFFWKGPFECNELLQQGRFEPPKRNVVDSRSCGSKGGGCNTQKSLCSTLFPCQERQALAIGPGKCQQCQPVRNARPGSATGARAGAQSHLHRALFGSGRADSFRARFLVHVDLHRRQSGLSGLHRSNNRVRGILFLPFTAVHNQHGSSSAATASRIGSAWHGSPGTCGRHPSLYASVSVIGLSLGRV